MKNAKQQHLHIMGEVSLFCGDLDSLPEDTPIPKKPA